MMMMKEKKMKEEKEEEEEEEKKRKGINNPQNHITEGYSTTFLHPRYPHLILQLIVTLGASEESVGAITELCDDGGVCVKGQHLCLHPGLVVQQLILRHQLWSLTLRPNLKE
ncbi:hypothetical protein E2C01_052887 [Portunus trituberculatus]|uniref:Uncharacterized protein n=1 Tax=Portunus trituberculatus TaxID=210409 RepID=A0A5B7GNN4_PORTR|nr:hypothetical protein [Portunus trituberculatus]